MENAMIMAFALFAEQVVTRSLGALLIGVAVVGTMASVWWGTAERTRDAKGGPVMAATTRDYVAVAAMMGLGVTCMLVGLYLWNR